MPAVLLGNDAPARLSAETYFRLLLVGYFEGIDSERGIAWRAGGSGLTPGTPRRLTSR